jgi:hypothetical protein
MKKLLFAAVFYGILQTNALAQNCASNAYISTGANCISLSWFPQSNVPDTLPATIEFGGIVYTLTNGEGDIAFPAIYRKEHSDCVLPSDYVNGNITIDFAGGSITCQYPGGTLLALRDISLSAYTKNSKTVVDWTVDNRGIERFLVENSSNAVDFTAVASIAPNAATGAVKYTWSTDKPLGSFYRVKVFEKDNKAYYSKIALTDAVEIKPGIYPSPNKGSFVVKGISGANVSGISIHDSQGRKLAFRNLGYDAGRQLLSISLLNKTSGLIMVTYQYQNKYFSIKTLVE